MVGKTGSGKTTWAKAQALQAARLGRLVVAIDPHGHWKDIATVVIDARRYIPAVEFLFEDFSGIDMILDILRAGGVNVTNVHFTALLNTLDAAGGKANLPKIVETLRMMRDPRTARDPLLAIEIDEIYGRLKALAAAKTVELPAKGIVVVTTEGDEEPHSVMRLISWLFAYTLWAKRTCPTAQCPLRLEIYVDEAHLLLRHLEMLARMWRGLRKFGVRLVAMSQDVDEFGGPLSAIIANSDTKAILAIDPTQLPYIAQTMQIDPKVLERVASESVPEERHAVLRVGGRAPIYITLAKPDAGKGSAATSIRSPS